MRLKMFSLKRRYKIPAVVILVLVFLFIVVPYLVPLADRTSPVPAQSLVAASGRFLDIGPYQIYVEDQGHSSGDAVVLLHGFGGSTFTWRDNAPFLADRGYRVIAPDLKGFGLSSRGWQPDYSHQSQAGIVAAVLRELDIPQAYFIGHSMGSSVMFHFAHLYPKKVLGMISVNGAVNLRAGSRIPSIMLRFPPFRRAARVILTHYVNQERFLSILESAYYRREVVTSSVFEGYYHRAIRNGWDESLLGMTRDMPGNVIDFPLETLDFPTLVIRGEEDTWVSRADIDAWKDRIPGAVFYPIAGSGHLPMEEHPAVFNDRVLDFLRSTGEQEPGP